MKKFGKPTDGKGSKDGRGDRRESGRKPYKEGVRKPYKEGEKKDFDKKEVRHSKPHYNKTDKFSTKTTEKKKVLFLDESSLEGSTRIGQPAFKAKDSDHKSTIKVFDNTDVRLNKFIANAGVCSRREADELITMGLITVNGIEVTDFSFRVKPSDRVKYNDQLLNAEERVYLLMNKPKGFITTTSDPEDRKTVVDIVESATPFRVYPVGRLDRNTTGVLLMTNDGDFMEKITHPRFNIHKVYKVTLEEKATLAQLEQLLEGVSLEDGMAKADAIAFLDESKTIIGVEIHSGKNRIIRRMFESIGHDVKRLDRTAFGPFTKTKLKPGEFRFLNDKELVLVERLKNQKTQSKPGEGAPKKKYEAKTYVPKKDYGSKKPFDRKGSEDKPAYGENKSYGEFKKFDNKKPFDRKSGEDKPAYGEKKSYGEFKKFDNKKSSTDKKPFSSSKKNDVGRGRKEKDRVISERKSKHPKPTRNVIPKTKKKD